MKINVQKGEINPNPRTMKNSTYEEKTKEDLSNFKMRREMKKCDLEMPGKKRK